MLSMNLNQILSPRLFLFHHQKHPQFQLRMYQYLHWQYHNQNLPEKEMKQIDLIGSVYVSKGVISLKNDRGTSYEIYIKVQNELTRAFQELRDELSIEKFGTKYDKLAPEKQEAIQSVIPMAISEAEPENVGNN